MKNDISCAVSYGRVLLCRTLMWTWRILGISGIRGVRQFQETVSFIFCACINELIHYFFLSFFFTFLFIYFRILRHNKTLKLSDVASVSDIYRRVFPQYLMSVSLQSQGIAPHRDPPVENVNVSKTKTTVNPQRKGRVGLWIWTSLRGQLTGERIL